MPELNTDNGDVNKDLNMPLWRQMAQIESSKQRKQRQKRERELIYGLMLFLASSCFLGWVLYNRYGAQQNNDVVPVANSNSSGSSSTYQSSRPAGMDYEQSKRYDNLSSKGKQYVDEQMRNFDAAPVTNSGGSGNLSTHQSSRSADIYYENSKRYENLSPKGKQYVDDQMRKYDAICSRSDEC